MRYNFLLSKITLPRDLKRQNEPNGKQIAVLITLLCRHWILMKPTGSRWGTSWSKFKRYETACRSRSTCYISHQKNSFTHRVLSNSTSRRPNLACFEHFSALTTIECSPSCSFTVKYASWVEASLSTRKVLLPPTFTSSFRVRYTLYTLTCRQKSRVRLSRTHSLAFARAARTRGTISQRAKPI